MELGHTEAEYRAQRLEHLKRLAAAGHAPFGGAFARDGNLADIRASFQEGRRVRIAGRMLARREMGKAVFADLRDGTGRLQIYLKRDELGDAAFDAFGWVDFGDFIGAEGELFTTRTGEPSLKVRSWTLLAKALRAPPEKWHGLHDVEIRYRKRYLDLIANPEVRDLFNKRIAIVRAIRDFLHGRGFQEVETPMMQPMAGGAAATPFKTHYDALDCDMYLRIAPELYLKRLLVGGFDKIFELNRNFRNEGLSRFHNPEFTMLEIYEAYGDRTTMQQLVQDLICHAAQSVLGTLSVGTKDQPVDLTPPWRVVTYRDLITERMGSDWYSLSVDQMRARAITAGVHVDPAWGAFEITHEIFEKVIEKTLVNPTFVIELPAPLVPLAKLCPKDPSCVDVFELVIGGREIAPGYSELNDPLEQRRRFEEQANGDPSKIDEDFLTALEYGMPPAGGMGIGIDRLVMLLCGAEAIRDVILFPQMRPLAKG
ncbi:MAG: lysine--tRNA ligase [Kiritimatiellae bacterium]|nr:lysine--tRNA ligase [Kiritimatiellia bacterium]MDW8459165.1 lysine--tRNA ligase [Verrucomicrobiota bacterium]